MGTDNFATISASFAACSFALVSRYHEAAWTDLKTHAKAWPFEAIICISEGASVRDRDPALGPTTPVPVPDTGDWDDDLEPEPAPTSEDPPLFSLGLMARFQAEVRVTNGA